MFNFCNLLIKYYFINILLLIFTNTVYSYGNKLVIAHRGSSGYLPEHTLGSAVMAYASGADYLELDLVMSKDEHLMVLHDLTLNATTNVEQVFPDRAGKDGKYHAADFYLHEVKQLKVHELSLIHI